ncbi:MAG: VOC family protein [Actinomycetes bacterium]
MTPTLSITLSATVLGAPDAQALADFYRHLLGWEQIRSDPGWVQLRCPAGGAGLSFQEEKDYRAPVWPERPGEQQMLVHLDIRVDDLDAAAAHAIALGSTPADYQPQDHVRVHLDPAGHPFCLFV